MENHPDQRKWTSEENITTNKKSWKNVELLQIFEAHDMCKSSCRETPSGKWFKVWQTHKNVVPIICYRRQKRLTESCIWALACLGWSYNQQKHDHKTYTWRYIKQDIWLFESIPLDCSMSWWLGYLSAQVSQSSNTSYDLKFSAISAVHINLSCQTTDRIFVTIHMFYPKTSTSTGKKKIQMLILSVLHLDIFIKGF